MHSSYLLIHQASLPVYKSVAFLDICFAQLSSYTLEPQSAPTNVHASGVGSFDILLEWNRIEFSERANGYIIEYQHGNSKKQTLEVNAETDSILIEGLYAGSEYKLEVCAYNDVGVGPCDATLATTLNTGKLFSINRTCFAVDLLKLASSLSKKSEHYNLISITANNSKF